MMENESESNPKSSSKDMTTNTSNSNNNIDVDDVDDVEWGDEGYSPLLNGPSDDAGYETTFCYAPLDSSTTNINNTASATEDSSTHYHLDGNTSKYNDGGDNNNGGMFYVNPTAFSSSSIHDDDDDDDDDDVHTASASGHTLTTTINSSTTSTTIQQNDDHDGNTRQSSPSQYNKRANKPQCININNTTTDTYNNADQDFDFRTLAEQALSSLEQEYQSTFQHDDDNIDKQSEESNTNIDTNNATKYPDLNLIDTSSSSFSTSSTPLSKTTTNSKDTLEHKPTESTTSSKPSSTFNSTSSVTKPSSTPSLSSATQEATGEASSSSFQLDKDKISNAIQNICLKSSTLASLSSPFPPPPSSPTNAAISSTANSNSQSTHTTKTINNSKDITPTTSLKDQIRHLLSNRPNNHQQEQQQQRQQRQQQQHDLIPTKSAIAWNRQTIKAIQATHNMSRSATIAEAMVRLSNTNTTTTTSSITTHIDDDDNDMNNDFFVIHCIGADHVECTSHETIINAVGPFVRWLDAAKRKLNVKKLATGDIGNGSNGATATTTTTTSNKSSGLDQVLERINHVRIEFIGPNVPIEASNSVGRMNLLPKSTTTTTTTTAGTVSSLSKEESIRGLLSCTAKCTRCNYHDYLQELQQTEDSTLTTTNTTCSTTDATSTFATFNNSSNTTTTMNTTNTTSTNSIPNEWFYPKLVIAFNAGIWGYDDWIPTLQSLCNFPHNLDKMNHVGNGIGIPFVITAYTVQEAEDDAEVIQEVVMDSYGTLCCDYDNSNDGGDRSNCNESSKYNKPTNNDKKFSWKKYCLWEAEVNPYGSNKQRDTATADPNRIYHENGAWQAWLLGSRLWSA